MKFSEYTITYKNTRHAYGEHFYNKLIEKWRGENFNFLELGVQYGSSILAFAQTLPNAKIYGIDINLEQNQYQKQHESTGRVILHQFDLYSSNSLEIAKEKLGTTKFGIIVDDASHSAHHQVRAFKNFYPRLSIGGTYIIECCNDIKFVVNEIKPYVGGGTIEVIDLRSFKNKLADDVLVVVEKFSRLIFL